MRLIELVVTQTEMENAAKRDLGDKEFAGGVFGEVETLAKLLESSPNIKGPDDVINVYRVSTQIRKKSDGENRGSEYVYGVFLNEEDWEWLKKMLTHDKYASYGSGFLVRFGGLLKKVFEAQRKEVENGSA